MPAQDGIDEEALAMTLPAKVRLERGAFFTPTAIVDRVLDLVAPLLAEFGASRPVRFVDPACGAGAFLSAAAHRWPHAKLLGVDLETESLIACRARLPGASLVEANALTADVFDGAAPGSVEIWAGNPPYNGTSPLLRDVKGLERARQWLPDDLPLPHGTSLRDDYIFFLLRASKHLEGREGVLAFVTSSTWLDAFQHGPVRQAVLRRLSLRHVVKLGPGIFRDARVSTCITVWSTRPSSQAIEPAAPDFALVAPSPHAEALDARWRQSGLTLRQLVPVSFAGLKTRFDELLVDDDRERLIARIRDVGRSRSVETFCEKWQLPARTRPKLAALWHVRFKFDERNIRVFHRYRGPHAMGRPAWCYLERALIPRGDHRLQGSYDPHAHHVKLVFNTRELPLAARIIEAPGCVTAYRHSRFAPLMVPKRVLEEGAQGARSSGLELGPLVPNLHPSLSQLDARALFERVAAFVNSPSVQTVWAPSFGTRRDLPVPRPVIFA